MADTELGTLILRLKADITDLKKGLKDAENTIKGSTDSQKKGADTLGQSIAGIKTQYLAFAAAAVAVAMTIRKAFDWAELGARAEAVQESFDAITKGVGVNGEQLKTQIKSAAGVYIDETEFMIMANKLLAEGISATDIPKLFEAARVAARLMGTDVNEAMTLVTRAVLTFQTRGLFRQAFPMESTKVFKDYADAIGLDADMLSTFGKQQAMVNEILRQSAEKMQVLGGPGGLVRNHYENLQLLSSAYMEAKEMIGKFIVDGVMWLSDALGNVIGIVETVYEKITSIPKAIKGIITSASELLGITSKAPPPLELAAGHGPAAPPELELAASHGPAVKAQQDKDVADRDKLNKEIKKNQLDAEKARVDAEGQIRIYGLEVQHNRALTEANRLGQDTLDIDQKFARDKAAMELKNTIDSLEAQRNAEITAAIAAGKTESGQKEAINAKINAAEKSARAKFREEVTKLDLDETKKGIEEKLAIDEAATKTEMSNQQAILDQAQDYYDRLLISAKNFYKIKEDIMMSTGTSEIKMLQERLDLETDEGKKAGLRAEIADKVNKLEKDLTTNTRDTYKALQAEADLHSQILQTDTSRQNVMIDMAREKFEITEADALTKRIQLQKDLLSALQAQLDLTNKIEDPKKYADIQLAMAQVNAQIQTMNIQLTEQVGTFAQLSDLGMKRYADSLQKNLINTTENLVPNAFDAAGNSVKGFINNLVDGTMSASEALKEMGNSFAKSVLNMIVDIGLLIAKMEILKALGYGEGATSGTSGGSLGGMGGGGGLGGILNIVVGLIGSIFQSGGPVTGPSGTDRVPIRATAGEFVIRQSAVKKYGSGFMAMINEGMLDVSKLVGMPSQPQPTLAFAGGGQVTSQPAQTMKNEITLINVVDSRDMDKWAASAAGQNSIINVLSSRLTTVKKIVR